MGYGRYEYRGKERGYAVETVCEERGCNTEIDRGMAYACGGVPGDHDDYCDGYFCAKHLYFTDSDFGASSQRCKRCADAISPASARPVWLKPCGGCAGIGEWGPQYGEPPVDCPSCGGSGMVEDRERSAALHIPEASDG